MENKNIQTLSPSGDRSLLYYVVGRKTGYIHVNPVSALPEAVLILSSDCPDNNYI